MERLLQQAGSEQPVDPTLPRFSVIVPTYNRPLQLTGCLEALGSLDYPRECFEVVVVDDGSDVSLDSVIAEAGSRVSVSLIVQRRAGPAAARNAGAKLAKGTVLAFTDDDCRPSADWLRSFAARFAETPDRIVGGRTVNALNGNPYSRASQLIVDIVYSYYNTDPADARFFASNNLAMSAERFEAVGGFDPTFTTAEDRDLCDRWVHQGHAMTYAPEAVVYHAHSLTFSTFCRQHFRYGRGAFRFHQMRARRGSGRFTPELRFYLEALGQAFRGNHQPALRPPLLLLWWLANTTGFLCQMAMPRKGMDPSK